MEILRGIKNLAHHGVHFRKGEKYRNGRIIKWTEWLGERME
jgi:hypothetical protein